MCFNVLLPPSACLAAQLFLEETNDAEMAGSQDTPRLMALPWKHPWGRAGADGCMQESSGHLSCLRVWCLGAQSNRISTGHAALSDPDEQH